MDERGLKPDFIQKLNDIEDFEIDKMSPIFGVSKTNFWKFSFTWIPELAHSPTAYNALTLVSPFRLVLIPPTCKSWAGRIGIKSFLKAIPLLQD